MWQDCIFLFYFISFEKIITGGSCLPNYETAGRRGSADADNLREGKANASPQPENHFPFILIQSSLFSTLESMVNQINPPDGKFWILLEIS